MLSHLSHEFMQPTLEDTINPASIKLCNQRINKMYDDFKDFLSSHYQGGRTDTEFWKYITYDSNAVTDFARDLRDMCKSRIPTKFDFPSYPGAAGWLIWCYILLGTGQLTSKVTAKYLDKRTITDSEYYLNHLSIFAEKTRLTHYNYNEHIDIVKNYNIKFNPYRGSEWHLGNI